jgi:hypothetical protein
MTHNNIRSGVRFRKSDNWSRKSLIYHAVTEAIGFKYLLNKLETFRHLVLNHGFAIDKFNARSSEKLYDLEVSAVS